MTVLDEIIVGVREDIEMHRRELSQLRDMAQEIGPTRDPLPSFHAHQLSIIAEIKRASPSKGALAPILDPAELGVRYQSAGASVVSVLTESRRFGGSLNDLREVRQAISLPVLRKDFMVDEYQFHEARAFGADIVLLIVAALSASQLREFYLLAKSLDMKSLVEIHNEAELALAMEISPEIIGVNSRDLKDLSINKQIFARLLPLIPDSLVKVAESGISTRADVIAAQNCGADALLIGEALVRGGDPESTVRALLGRG